MNNITEWHDWKDESSGENLYFNYPGKETQHRVSIRTLSPNNNLYYWVVEFLHSTHGWVIIKTGGGFGHLSLFNNGKDAKVVAVEWFEKTLVKMEGLVD